MKKQFEEALMDECYILELLLEQSENEEEAKPIRDMLISISTYLNDTVED